MAMPAQGRSIAEPFKLRLHPILMHLANAVMALVFAAMGVVKRHIEKNKAVLAGH